jgi:hypothetical protein
MSGRLAGFEGNAMTALSRSPIGVVFSAMIVASIVGLGSSADAAKSTGHRATVESDLAAAGFLDLKTFIVVPLGDDGELGLASEQTRVISPETLFSRQPRIDLLKSIKRGGDDGFFGAPATSTREPDFDSMTVKVNGQPFTLSLGLREAILKDIETNIRTYGDPGLFNGGVGFASASYLGAMTNDIIGKIDRLESIAGEQDISAGGRFMVSGPVYVIPTPSTMPVFLAGLVVVAWLRRPRRNHAARPA